MVVFTYTPSLNPYLIKLDGTRPEGSCLSNQFKKGFHLVVANAALLDAPTLRCYARVEMVTKQARDHHHFDKVEHMSSARLST